MLWNKKIFYLKTESIFVVRLAFIEEMEMWRTPYFKHRNQLSKNQNLNCLPTNGKTF